MDRGLPHLTLASARRIALAAQGFGKPRPARPPSVNQIAALVERLGVLQLDSVNVFLRSHYMPVFSRLGPYDRTRLDRIAGHGIGRIDRRLVEYWAHEASLFPIELHPLFRWRMADVDREAWGSILEDRPRAAGPGRRDARAGLRARADPRPGHRRGPAAPPARAHVELARRQGRARASVLHRAGGSGQPRQLRAPVRQDRPRVPAEVLAQPTPDPADAQRRLVRIAARALGVATEPDIGDYFRLPRADSKERVAELVASGELTPVAVDGWNAPAYLWPDARRPRRLQARALLTPFDSLVWFRQRTERLFNFRYRIEIYTPAAKRTHGYYVLPFLLGETLVARVDLKSDRQRSALLVQGAFAEDGVDRTRVAAELAAELRLVASWLDLERVAVARNGDLSRELAAIIG